jgi:cytochrome P450
VTDGLLTGPAGRWTIVPCRRADSGDAGGTVMADTITYDPFDAAFHDDPYPTLAALREGAPLHRTELGTYLLTRYEDVWSLVRDRRLGRDVPMELMKMTFGDGPAAEAFVGNMLNREGKDHTRVRKLMASPFTPGRVRELRVHTEALVDELFDALDDEFDAAADIGLVLPVLVICDLLGLPKEDRELVRPWAAAIADGSTLITTDALKTAMEAALQAFIEYFEDLLAGRRTFAADGLFAALVAAEEDGERLDHQELVVNAVLLFFAGFETTTNLIGNGTLALLRHPDQYERVRDDPDLVPTAVDEMLRFDSPVMAAPRITHEPIETSGGTIKANRVIELSLSAANRDPRVFTDAERFDVGRTDNHHVAFGSGAHFCLGAHLARLEAQAVLAGFTSRFRALEPNGDLVRKSSVGIRGLDSLPVRGVRR